MPTPQTASKTLETLGRLLRKEAASQPGRINFVRLQCDPSFAKEVETALPSHLCDMGLDFIDIEVRGALGEPALLEVRRDAGWA